MSKKNLRFVKDYNLPINIFNDEMFSYYRELYKDFWPHEAENLLNKEIERFNGNVDMWLEDCGHLRDTIIETLENSDAYKGFNSCDLSKYDIPNMNIGEHSLYTEETDGKFFISIDLKKANFQALKHVGILASATYEDFIKYFGGSDYFAGSKYLRQVIFGKLNPKRQIKVEKYLIYQTHEMFLNFIDGFTLYSINSDELVYKVNDNLKLPLKEELRLFQNIVKAKLGIEVRVELVTIKRLPIVNSNGNKVDAYVRTNVHTGEEVLKKASTTFFPQIYKLWKGMEINEKDLTFFFEDQLATFNKPLILTK